ncbi:NTP pyrophosphohydrolase [Saccharothrix obliqua]|uniref:NTP pyrophosphohydrolase n=1 Tax=Saccharothrix obliqua TaxID=2861747 RepID=UPI001C607362|nr:NTP pyrophosphohydrolase [Saccharothrix obliqua]MBW4715581.1 NTP pyrophosphohydrolase [Saccharothrix obliqua]
MTRPLLVVDGANVIGSVPDGWWRDRAAAATRLRNALVGVGERGVPGFAEGPVEVVLVVEGKARHVQSIPGVRVVSATASGDDAIVAVVRAESPGRQCAVVTADRGLRARVTALGATTLGPRAVR